MATLRVRGPYSNEFEIDATARSFWEHREGYTILPGDEPEAPVEATTQPSKKAAPRPASDDKE